MLSCPSHPVKLLAALMAGSLLSVLSAVEPDVPVESILDTLPPGMEANLVDPLSVEKAPSFQEGEHFNFKLGWSLFKVARSTMKVEPMAYGESQIPALRITLNTRTNGFADAFYKVRNLSTSWISEDVSRSFEYSAVQSEGERDRDTVAYFDPESLTAYYVNNIDETRREPVRILPGTFDPLGIVFFIRSLDFEVGDELVVPTSNGKEFFYTVVRVTGKVKRKFAMGRREAWVLEPDIKDVGGVFKRSPDGHIKFFFSADDEKLPLRMESEVAVGKFWAELVKVVEPGEDP